VGLDIQKIRAGGFAIAAALIEAVDEIDEWATR
jgi:hypothetical protein